jgi:hypothetical protein
MAYSNSAQEVNVILLHYFDLSFCIYQDWIQRDNQENIISELVSDDESYP